MNLIWNKPVAKCRLALILNNISKAIISVTLLSCAVDAQEVTEYQRPALMTGGLNIKPHVTALTDEGDSLTFVWQGIAGPFQVQQLTDFVLGDWGDVGEPIPGREVTIPKDQDHAIYRLTMTPNYVGAQACELCHSVTFNHWAETAHAHALDTLKVIGRDTNSRCLQCHTLGYGQSTGYVSEEETPQFVGVQCENCHGPGGDHAANPFEVAPPIVELASEMCGGCHTGSHHGFYDDWIHSSHSKAITTIKSNSHAGDHCLKCHSQDYRYAEAFERPTPGVETAKLSLECSTCHDPHRSGGPEHQLRKPIGQLCGECHTVGESLLGSSPHHPQFEMLQGIGAFNEDGTPLNQVGPHSILFREDLFPEGKGCAQCHIVNIRPEQVNQGSPVRTGHTFNPFDETIPNFQAETQYEGCTLCHTTTWAGEHRTAVQSEITDLLEEVSVYFDLNSEKYVDPDMIPGESSTQYKVAKFNYQYVDADGSHGIHNPANAKVALRTAKRILESLASAETQLEQ